MQPLFVHLTVLTPSFVQVGCVVTVPLSHLWPVAGIAVVVAAPVAEPAPERDVVAAANAPRPMTIAEQVRAEAEQAVARRRLAGMIGGVTPKSLSVIRDADDPLAGLTMGGRMQALSMKDSVAPAIALLRERWPNAWAALCRHAARGGVRPVVALVELIEANCESDSEARSRPNTGVACPVGRSRPQADVA